MRTRKPASASAAPRFTAVVVLPTPPFWFAMASTLGSSSGLAAPSTVSVGSDCGSRIGPSGRRVEAAFSSSSVISLTASSRWSRVSTSS